MQEQYAWCENSTVLWQQHRHFMNTFVRQKRQRRQTERHNYSAVNYAEGVNIEHTLSTECAVKQLLIHSPEYGMTRERYDTWTEVREEHPVLPMLRYITAILQYYCNNCITTIHYSAVNIHLYYTVWIFCRVMQCNSNLASNITHVIAF